MTVAVQFDLSERAELFLTDFSHRAEPWEFFRELRDTAPLVRSSSGTWLAARAEDCVAVLAHPSLSRRVAAARTSGLPAGEAAEQSTTRLICEDGADHLRLRRIVNGPFSGRNVRKWEPRIRGVLTGLLEAHDADRRMDFLEDVALPLPGLVLCELLGVPSADLPKMTGWLSLLLEHINQDADAEFSRAKHEAMVSLSVYLRHLVASSRDRDDSDDLMAAMIKAESDSDRLSERELIGILAELLHAGAESTANTMTNGLRCLLEHPEQQAKLAADPSLAQSAFEEMLRFATPVLHALPRVALEDVELPSGTIPAGDMVIALVSSASRDPRVVENPDEFDITRRPNPHMAFGSGEHFCLGNLLARSEATFIFERLAETILPTMQIDGPLAWKPHHIIRGLEALPVRW